MRFTLPEQVFVGICLHNTIKNLMHVFYWPNIVRLKKYPFSISEFKYVQDKNIVLKLERAKCEPKKEN